MSTSCCGVEFEACMPIPGPEGDCSVSTDGGPSVG